MKKKNNYSNKVRPDYSRKNFKNPFYYREKKTHWLFRYWRWSLSILIIILGSLAWLIFFSKVFMISSWQIDGLSRLNEAQIRQVITDTSSRNNIFSYPKDKLQANLLDKFNLLEANISRNIFKKTFSINIKERVIAFIYTENGKYYYIDKDAYIVEEIQRNEDDLIIFETGLDNSYPLIENTVDAKIGGKRINWQDFSFSVFSNIKDRLSGEGLKKFLIDNNLYSLRVELDSDCYLVLSLENDLDKQLDAYFTFKNGRLPGSSTQVDINKLKKIDLRDTAREEGDKRIYYELK